MTFLPCEILVMIIDEYADDLSMLHSCILVNRNWCVVALQYLWAKPFTLLYSSPKRTIRRSTNLIAIFNECFTDVDALENTSRVQKECSKKFPFDYRLYLKELHLKEIHTLTRRTRFSWYDVPARITRLAIKYCPILSTLSLTGQVFFLVDPSMFLVSIKSLPCLQNLSWYLELDNSIFSTLSRAAHNLKSISVEVSGVRTYNFEQELHNGLQKLIQAQHQLKSFTIKKVITKMRSVFELLESQSNSLESIFLEYVDFNSDDSNIESIKFDQLTSISIKDCQVSIRGLKSILKADLPKLQILEFENTDWRRESDWT